MHHHDRLGQQARALRQREKFLRMADLLDEQRRDPGLLVLDQRAKEIFRRQIGFVAGGNVERDAEPLAAESHPHDRRDRAALRDDADLRIGIGGRALDIELEGEGGPDREAAHADAVRPEHRDIRRARRGAEFLLLGAPFLAHFGEAGREYDRAADAAPAAGRNGVEYRSLRHHQHRRIDPERKLVDARDARPAVDLGARAADQVDVAFKSASLQVGEHRPAQVTGLRRHPDDGDRARPQQAGQPRCARVHAAQRSRR
jgi:hypothetical protein